MHLFNLLGFLFEISQVSASTCGIWLSTRQLPCWHWFSSVSQRLQCQTTAWSGQSHILVNTLNYSCASWSRDHLSNRCLKWITNGQIYFVFQLNTDLLLYIIIYFCVMSLVWLGSPS